MKTVTNMGNLRLTWVDALNLAAICGSMSIMTSFFLAILALRSSTWSTTQALNGLPITVVQTLMIYCLGVFGKSGSSGM